MLGLPLSKTVKSLVLATDATTAEGAPAEPTIWLLLVRGDHSLNEVKAGKLPGLDKGFRFATPAEIESTLRLQAGLPRPDRRAAARRRIVVDRTVAAMSDFVAGANEADFHFTGVNWGRDLPEPDLVADIRNAVVGDPSPDGKGTLQIQRGIEVGHVFLLGSHYSKAMDATFLDEKGQPQLLQMGCYGIGITRIVGAAIEQNNDERGMIWPQAIAPFARRRLPDRLRPLRRGPRSRRRAPRRPGRRRHRRRPRRPRRAARGDVRRLGADRRAASHRPFRSRPEEPASSSTRADATRPPRPSLPTRRLPS